MVEMTKTSPRDVFMHLTAALALYVSATSFGMLVFLFIDILFPDQLTHYYTRPVQAIRWPLALLVVLFPAYVWAAWSLCKGEALVPEKRELKIRNWLLYFTLFAASAVIIGDLVTLLYNFLGGELSARFILKVLTVFFIAAVVFAYYLWSLRSRVMASRDPRLRLLVSGVIGIVGAAMIAGFFAAGSPFRERLRRFDDKRTQDLQSIQWQIVNYWQKKEKLPAFLDELRDDISGFVPPSDPESGAAYEYKTLASLKFELCASFKTESGTDGVPQPVLQRGRGSESWTHGVGRTCFERTVDPELYPPFEKPKRAPGR